MNSNRGIKNLLKLICLLQDNSRDSCQLDDGCTKPFLGPNFQYNCYNTRVITLYTKNGSLFSANYIDNGTEQVSNLFRVQSVINNKASLLILRESDGTYFSTDSYITVNISCICAVKCINDVVVQGI